MTDRIPTTPHSAGIRDLVARHPVSAFLIMVFSIAYPVMSLLALAVHGIIPGGALLERLPFPPDEVAGLLLTMCALLPSALFVTWAADGRPGVLHLFKRMARWRFGVGWWLAVLAGLPLLTVVSALILGDSLASVDPVKLVWDQLRLLLINFILVNLGGDRLGRCYANQARAAVQHLRGGRADRRAVWICALAAGFPQRCHDRLGIDLTGVFPTAGSYPATAGRSHPQRLPGQRACSRTHAQRLQPNQQRE